MLHHTSIGLDVHARGIAAAAFIPETGEVFAEIVRLRRRRGRLLGESPAAAGVVRLRIGAHGLRPKEKARRKRRGMPGRSSVEGDSGRAFRFRCCSRPRGRGFQRC